MFLVSKYCLHYQLRSGPFAGENWYLFTLFTKPWNKLGTFAIGISAAWLYMKVLKYRREAVATERQRQHPYIDKLHHSKILHIVMMLTGLTLVATNLLIGHSAIAAPYSWTMTENVLYYALTRPTYALGIFLIIFVFFTGGFTFGKGFLGGTSFRLLGKLTYETAIITPLMIQLIYN